MSFSFGAADGTWTHTLTHTHLKRACLPIPALPHILTDKVNDDILPRLHKIVNYKFYRIIKLWGKREFYLYIGKGLLYNKNQCMNRK